MPRNPNKTHCSVEGCKAWAIRGSDPPLGVGDYARFISLLLQGANTLTRLVRTHNSLRGKDVDEILREIFDAALDELSEEWGVDL
jgi:hypothetical protein